MYDETLKDWLMKSRVKHRKYSESTFEKKIYAQVSVKNSSINQKYNIYI